MKKLEPTVYTSTSKELPGHLYTKGGLLYVRSSQIHEGIEGPFHLIADFGQSLQGLRQKTPVDYYPDEEQIHYHARENDQVARATDNLTRLPNSGVGLKSSALSVVYAANFGLTIIDPLKSATEGLEEKATLLAPLRGGEVVQIIADALRLPVNSPQVRASRVVGPNGEYLVGVHELEEVQVENHVIVGDDCLAAAGSISAMAEYAQAKNPNTKGRIRIAVGVGVVRSAEALSTTLGQQVEIGGAAHAMDGKYYLAVTNEQREKSPQLRDATYRVNDMGEIMNLGDPRKRKKIVPVLTAIAQGGISPDLIFATTEEVLENPGKIDSIIQTRFAEFLQ